MDIILRLLISAFEALQEGDAEEAAHRFRTVADEVELQGCPDVEDLYTLASNLVDMLQE